ncbi:DUF4838 domain-containing protein [Sphingobacterium sp. KU25419]|nr:DUF4838 domain-containing protein [Sphingobacterium sp. KU25419]
MLLIVWCSSCKGLHQGFDFGVADYHIVSNGDKESAEMADYLYLHLSKRLKKEKPLLQFVRSESVNQQGKENTIYVELVPDLKFDYKISNEAQKLSLYIKDKSTAKWIIYMLIDHLGQHHQALIVSDLPPAYIDFSSAAVKFPLAYRDPHLLPNMDQDYAGLLATNTVDRDWGLWGHNMKQVFAYSDMAGVQAIVDGQPVTDQYCFSSSQTFDAINHFIVEEYGTGERESKKFMIAPNDNDKVCTCSKCIQQGNTKTSATGAVVELLNRLGEKFRKHAFFTIAYRTTSIAPKVMMRENTGVFLSTIDLPKNSRLNLNRKEVKQFITMLDSWKLKCQQRYLWDYISNFDDYLSPFPMLYRIQQQLPFFMDQGITGIFMNGSGYDYSPFDDVKTYVLAALMMNPKVSIPDLVKNFYQRFYPKTGTLLAAYYLELESGSSHKGKDISIYTPFRVATVHYLDTRKFVELYRDIQKKYETAQGEEREKIQLMMTAWSYTYLQVCYQEGFSGTHFVPNGPHDFKFDDKLEQALARLGQYKQFPMLTQYKEANGELSTYLKEWQRLKMNGLKTSVPLALRVSSTATGESMEESKLLSDQMLGFASDFNQGWFLGGEDITVAVDWIKPIAAQSEIKIRF